jgi:isocitrate/isopropylmalate dehydrogenase
MDDDEIYAVEEVDYDYQRSWEITKRTRCTLHLRGMALGANIRSAGTIAVFETESDEAGDQIVIRQLKDGTYRVNRGNPLTFSKTPPSVVRPTSYYRRKHE